MTKGKKTETEAEGGKAKTAGAEAAQGAEQNFSPLPVMIHAQYIKDLSIENPNAPHSLKAGSTGRPTLDVNFTMDAQKVQGEGVDNLFEVTLGIEAVAKRDENVAFIIELQYAVLVSLNNVPDDQAHPLLLIEMPRYIFPFARQIVADATQQAGFTALMLQPVDFREFYIQRYANRGAPPENVAKTA